MARDDGASMPCREKRWPAMVVYNSGVAASVALLYAALGLALSGVGDLWPASVVGARQVDDHLVPVNPVR